MKTSLLLIVVRFDSDMEAPWDKPAEAPENKEDSHHYK